MQVSIRKHSSAKRAWRLGARLNWSIRGYDREQSQSNQSSHSSEDIDIFEFGTDVSLLHEWHPVRSKSINTIVGLGPELGFGVTDRESTRLSGDPESVRTSETDHKSYHAGLRGVFGVEWFFADQISLMAEYSLSVAYSYKSTESTNTDATHSTKSVTNTRSFELATNSVNFGVSVYF